MEQDIKRFADNQKDEAKPRYIVVEGPIGVGKTTLTKMLSKTLGYDTLLEKAEENPFLPKFYENPRNAALPTQLFFLLQRFQQINELHQEDLFSPNRVSDFLIEKDKLFAQVTLDKDELALYHQIYDHLTINTTPPDLVIYLQAPADVLLERIKHRGIPSEQYIDAIYLNELINAYTQLFHYYNEAPLLMVNASHIDWVSNSSDYDQLLACMLNITSGRHYYNPQPSL